MAIKLTEVAEWLDLGFYPDFGSLPSCVDAAAKRLALQFGASAVSALLEISLLNTMHISTSSPDGTYLIVGDHNQDDIFIDLSLARLLNMLRR